MGHGCEQKNCPGSELTEETFYCGSCACDRTIAKSSRKSSHYLSRMPMLNKEFNTCLLFASAECHANGAISKSVKCRHLFQSKSVSKIADTRFTFERQGKKMRKRKAEQGGSSQHEMLLLQRTEQPSKMAMIKSSIHSSAAQLLKKILQTR